MVASQERKTGGLYFEFGTGADVFNFCLDPGPGALVHAVSLGLRPDKLKAKASKAKIKTILLSRATGLVSPTFTILVLGANNFCQNIN